MAKDRINSISLLRLICMLLICICHFLQYYDNQLAFYFNVGVQIFFVISGYLYSKKDIENPVEFLKKNAIKVLVPYYVFLIPTIVLYSIFCPQNLSVMSVLKALVCADTISGLGHLWFVGYILFCYLITPYLSWFKKATERDSWITSIVKYCLLVIALVALGYLFESHFDMLNIGCYVVGYLIGVYQNRYGNFSKLAKICVIAGGILTLFTYAVRICYDFIGVDFGHIGHLVVGFSCIGSNRLFAVTIFVLFLFWRSVKYNSFLKLSDKYSYYIYVVHLLFILSPFSLMGITSNRCVNWMIVVICICLGSVLLHKASSIVLKMLQRERL